MNSLNSYMVTLIEFVHITFNRCITILAKHLRELLAEKVLIEFVQGNHTSVIRENILERFSETV